MAELDNDSTESAAAADPVIDPTARRCRICGQVVTPRQRRACPGACTRELRRRQQQFRRLRARRSY